VKILPGLVCAFKQKNAFMNLKLTLLTLGLLYTFTAFTQSQVGILKDPKWKAMSAYDSKYGTIAQLSNKTNAIIADVPDQDFAIVNLDADLNEKWLSPLKGFPLAIGEFRGQVMVIAASDRSFSKSFVGPYIAYLLEMETGKAIVEKVIYEDSKAYLEDPEFFFAKDGSYFRMSTRLTGMKRKYKYAGVNKSDKEYGATQNFSVINFDDHLNEKERINPVMPDGDTWTVSNSDASSFLITVFDKNAKKLHVATYVSSIAEPLKTVSIPVDLHNSSEIRGIRTAVGKDPFVNYVSFVYANAQKEMTLFACKVDFKDGTFKVEHEVFNDKYLKELRKTFVPFNKDYDDLEFYKTGFLSVKHIAEYEGKLLISLSSSYILIGKGSAAFDTSVLLNVYDQDLKKLYHQFIPRRYMSQEGEGNEIAFSLKNNTMRMIANNKSGMFANWTYLYIEMDFSTGQILKINKIPAGDIKKGAHIDTPSVLWYDDYFMLPYFGFRTILSSKITVQLQLLK
jgi:hypothetical protein